MNISSRIPVLAATVAVSAALLTGSTRARADIPPANTEQCQNKAAATACVTENGTDGTCQATTCTGRPEEVDAGDGGVTFVSTTYACEICTPGGQTLLPDGGVATTGSSSSSGCNVGSTSSTSSALGFAGLALGLALVLRKRTATRRAR